MNDIVRQTYNCPFYKRTVTVFIEREICDHPTCSQPQPHITDKMFYDCSDILNCGVAEIVDGYKLKKRFDLCPAHLALDIRKEDL